MVRIRPRGIWIWSYVMVIKIHQIINFTLLLLAPTIVQPYKNDLIFRCIVLWHTCRAKTVCDSYLHVVLGTIHLRRRQFLVWVGGSKIGQIYRRIVVKNCRREGVGVVKKCRRLKWMVPFIVSYNAVEFCIPSRLADNQCNESCQVQFELWSLTVHTNLYTYPEY